MSKKTTVIGFITLFILIALPTMVSAAEVCVSNVGDVPATCTGGEITQDTTNGCRVVVCGGLQILACDKPDSGEKQFFEMYKQSSTEGVEICLADTCISDNGFAVSQEYPICTEEPSDAVCGNGEIEEGEQCDDGNTNNGDGCSSTCLTEAECTDNDGDGYSTGEGDNCAPFDCNDDDPNIHPGARELCNEIDDNCNGEVDDIPIDQDSCEEGPNDPTCTDNDDDGFYQEGGTCGPFDCDDTNADVNPNATEICNGIDDNCSGDSDADVDEGGVCETECGNGEVEIGEQCDDNNTISGDGCSSTCQLEDTGVCGDGFVGEGEQCDDSNTNNGDGCSSTCQLEDGDDQDPVCGDGVLEAPEQCDDGNTRNGDGCSDVCQPETTGCFEDALTIPVTCTGGTVIHQEIREDGCREVWCEYPFSNGNRSAVLCNKPGNFEPDFFDMELESGFANGEICATLNVCVNFNNPYVESSEFPVCSTGCDGCLIDGVCYDDGELNPSNECQRCDANRFRVLWSNREGELCTDDGNSCTQDVCGDARPGIVSVCTHPAEPIGTACNDGGFCDGLGMCSEENSCFTNIVGMPVTCDGGSITQNTVSTNGCRTIACSSSSASLNVLACDKPSATNPEFFEMYKQSNTGTGLEICVDGFCLKSTDGFVRSSEYPICTDDSSTPPNTTENSPPFVDLKPMPNSGAAPLTVDLVVETNDPEGERLLLTYFKDASSSQMIGDDVIGDDGNVVDYNSNGKYDEEDLDILSDVRLGHASCPGTKVCDVNGDGSVNSQDVGHVRNFMERNSVTTTYDATTTAKVIVTEWIFGINPPPAHTVEDTAKITILPAGCFTEIGEVPVSCTGGTITEDTLAGCRTIICGGLQVLACDKPDNLEPEFFEMYKQSSVDGVEICLANTCISDNGYAKSPNYPVCA